MSSGPAKSRARGVAAAGLIATAGILVAGYEVLSPPISRSLQDPETAARPPPEIQEPAPNLLKPITADEAIAANAALPFVVSGLERPLSFLFDSSGGDPLARRAAVDCLTTAIYYEAAGESEQGQRAVAQVVLNRVRHPAFPASVCEVVYQGSERTTGCQFTFTCDGSLARRPSHNGWKQARRIAEQALAGTVEPAVGMSTHYHANWVAPYWAPELDKIAGIGAHLFYRWRGQWGRRQSFTQRYSGEVTANTRLTYVEDFLPAGGNEEAELLALASSVDPLPTGPVFGPVAKLSTTRQPKLVADETTAKPVVDEKKFELVDDGPGR